MISQPAKTFWGRQPARTFTGPSGATSLTISSTALAGSPCTMACWAKPTASQVNSSVMAMWYDGTNNFELLMDGLLPGVWAQGPTTFGYVELSAVPLNQWSFLCGTFSSNILRGISLNGGAFSTNTTNTGTPTAFTKLCIGAGYLIGSAYYANARIALPCFWNVVLRDDENRRLARGAMPWTIRPESIIACPDMRTLYDPFLGASWTNSGSTLAAPALPPTRRIFVMGKAPSAAGGAVIPVFMNQYRQRSA